MQDHKSTKQTDDVVAQRDEMMAQRDDLLAQRDDLLAQRDDLTAQRAQMIAQVAATNAKLDDQTLQIAKLSSSMLKYERLAARLEELSGSSGLGAEKLTLLTSSLDAMRGTYLDLVEQVVIGTIYDDPPMATFGSGTFDAKIRGRGLDWPKTAFSMIGAGRMRNFRVLIEKTIHDCVPGDIVETGVWRGGACIMARAVLAAYGVRDRRVILADSFVGLPPPNAEMYPADQDSTFHLYPELAVSLEDVKENFKKFELLDSQVLFFEGWFKDTMSLIPSSEIAVLRLDGDMYESTLTPLRALFDRVSRNGWIIVDDYEVVPACKAAVHDFLSEHKLIPEIKQIDGTGVFFQKA